ncbi:MAG: aminotransferase class I/II-fold pyridoxal phosphate-dependent enzyme [Bacteroidales bacterium]|jgi:aspartate/methionine/tyrosine aminotransferase|nr:aminotransferase class I/II-fold pyridoxal phosphate-dependent enzyme [Bacteroidales bacterium]
MDNPIIRASSRTGLVNEYYFSAKLAEIARMRQEGADIINLGIGSPDMPPAQEVTAELVRSASVNGNHGYQGYRGIPALRNAFSEWYQRFFRTRLDAETEILPLIGSKEGIMHISMAFLDPGDEVLVPDPGYPAYAAAASLAGGVVRKYHLKEETGWLPDIRAIEEAGTKKVKMMWINYPHMPTGTRATPELFGELVGFALRNRILLCNDNPYSFILNDKHLSILSVPGAKGTALELNSLSKSHNMAGWRIGMLAGHKRYIDDILRVKSNMDSGMFKPLQEAAAMALKAPDEWYRRLNDVYSRRRRFAEEIMDELGCSFSPSQSGLFLWGKIPGRYNNAEELTEELLHRNHLFVTPGSVFGDNGRSHIRISLCAEEEIMKKALRRIRTGAKTEIPTIN